jgi:pimeloyl-ACP methyl ester carboxylesterase
MESGRASWTTSTAFEYTSSKPALRTGIVPVYCCFMDSRSWPTAGEKRWRRSHPPAIHVVAPDLRGYGRTTGWDDQYDGDLAPFSTLNAVKDALSLVWALGYRSVAAVIGHDVGSGIAGWCSIIRPDVFRAVGLMGPPFGGAPAPVLNASASGVAAGPTIYDQLAALPRPRKHYQRYFMTREANDEMLHCPQGLHNFLRAYYHFKSADWKQNKPFPLKALSAEEFANMPAYYVMDMDKGMPETVAAQMPSAAEIAACRWMTEDDLRVYSSEYGRTGFQGGLQGYRARQGEAAYNADLRIFAGRTIDVPSLFIAGKSDWAVYLSPSAVDNMKNRTCTRMLGFHLLDGAGHWVQQERPEGVSTLLLQFLKQATQG